VRCAVGPELYRRPWVTSPGAAERPGGQHGAVVPFPIVEGQRRGVLWRGERRGAFDAVVDFDRALRDPAHPARMLPIYDRGDHLHPSDQGYNAMGDAVDLALFD